MKLYYCILILFSSLNIYSAEAGIAPEDQELYEIFITPDKEELTKLTDFIAKKHFANLGLKLTQKDQESISEKITGFKPYKKFIKELNISLRGQPDREMPLCFFFAKHGYDGLLKKLAEHLPLTMLQKYKGQNILEYFVSMRHGIFEMNRASRETAKFLIEFLKNQSEGELFYTNPNLNRSQPIPLSFFLAMNGYNYLLEKLAEQLPLAVLQKFKGQNILEYFISHKQGVFNPFSGFEMLNVMSEKTSDTAVFLINFLHNKGVSGEMFYTNHHAGKVIPLSFFLATTYSDDCLLKRLAEQLPFALLQEFNGQNILEYFMSKTDDIFFDSKSEILFDVNHRAKNKALFLIEFLGKHNIKKELFYTQPYTNRARPIALNFFLATKGNDSLLKGLARHLPFAAAQEFGGQNILEFFISQRHGVFKMNHETQEMALFLMDFLNINNHERELFYADIESPQSQRLIPLLTDNGYNSLLGNIGQASLNRKSGKK